MPKPEVDCSATIYGLTAIVGGTVQLIFNFMLTSIQITRDCLFFSCTLLKLACLIAQLAYSSLYLIITDLLVCFWALTRAACIANMLQVITARYVFTQVWHVQYLSSSNSSVPVRFGNHTHKGNELIQLVMTNLYYLYPNSTWLCHTTLHVF